MFLIKMMLLLSYVVWHERTKVIFIGGGDILLWYAQILKALGLAEATVVTLEDWSVANKHQSFYDRLNRLKIWLNDFLLARFDTKVIVFNREIYDARLRHLGEAATNNSVLHDDMWTWFLEKKTISFDPLRRNKILLLGTLRPHFGLEIMFDLLPVLNRTHGIKLKIIGPENDNYRRYRSEAERLGVQNFLEWRGFVKNQDLPGELEDCFAGLNLQELKVNDSSLTVAGRVVQYLQHLVVPIVTEHSGALSEVIKKLELGCVCHAEKAAISEAILSVMQNKAAYVDRIIGFLEKNQNSERSLW